MALYSVVARVLTLKETICGKICSKSRLKCAKTSLPVDVRSWKTSLLKVPLKIMTENWNLFISHEGNFQHYFVCLFFARPLIKIARGCHTQWRNYFDGTTPLLEKVRRYLIRFSYADYSKLNSNWHTYTNPLPGKYLRHVCAKPYHPGVSRQLSRPRGALIRDHQNMNYQQVHSDKPISMAG